ncbi:MAG TPA: hypothetical protein VFF73_24695 [Planctomycetota bacterium]|nr:hypothetical protein [Planctomycetota bacterium]
MSKPIRLDLEIVSETLLVGEVVPALSDRKALLRAVPGAVERLRGDPFASLARARLEAVLATGESPSTEAAREEVAWALLRSTRVAEPVTVGEDWDLLRVLLDPARRRGEGLSTIGRAPASWALMGAERIALSRSESYATGWNPRHAVVRIVRSLARVTPARLSRLCQGIDIDVARTVYPVRTSPLARRLPRALVALDRMRTGYGTAQRERAGVFVELVLP